MPLADSGASTAARQSCRSGVSGDRERESASGMRQDANSVTWVGLLRDAGGGAMRRAGQAIGLAVVITMMACTDSAGDDAKPDGPCDLLTQPIAVTVLGPGAEKVGLIEAIEAEDGPIAEMDLPAAEAAAARNCVYRSQVEDGEALVALQLDLQLFESVEDFTRSFADVEVLDGIGLAANFQEGDETRDGAVNVLLNDLGDSFALASYRAGATRDILVDLAAELANDYHR